MLEHASKMAVSGKASLHPCRGHQARGRRRASGVGWGGSSQALPSLPSEPSMLKTANAMMSPSMQLRGQIEKAEQAVLGVLRDEVALRAAEEDDDRVEGPHGGGEYLKVAEELLHRVGLLEYRAVCEADVDDAQHDHVEYARDGEVEEHHPVLPLPVEARREDARGDHENVRPNEHHSVGSARVREMAELVHEEGRRGDPIDVPRDGHQRTCKRRCQGL